MTLLKNNKNLVARFLLVTIVFLAILSALPAAAAPFRFVVMGDCRGPGQNNPINKSELTVIVNLISDMKPKPQFVVFNGDMAFIGGKTKGDTTNLEQWNGVMYPITVNPHQENEIRLYPTIGNHELYDGQKDASGKKRCTLFNQANYQDVYKKHLPKNGPAGYEGLAYSFEFGQGPEKSYFVIMDSFHIEANHNRDYWYQKFVKAQRDWLADKLEKHHNSPYIFVVSHMPIYPVKIERNDTLDRVWKILDHYNISAYFGAHEHLYDRCYIDSSVKPQFIEGTWKNKILHIISGRSGAWDHPQLTPAGWQEVDDDELIDGPAAPAGSTPTGRVTSHHFNFVVVDVQDGQAMVQAYGRPKAQGDTGHGIGNYKPIDERLSIESRIPGVSPALLDLLLENK